jgi:8-amino-7-oxononanoate synthase
MAQWDALVDAALARLEARSLLRATRPIALAPPPAAPETFAGPGPWDRAAVEIRLDRDTLHRWLAEGWCQANLPLPLCATCQSCSDGTN